MLSRFCPGSRKAGIERFAPATERSIKSPFLTPSSEPSTGEMRAQLSQATLVIGSGSSCSQPLLA